ncbi:MAG: GTP cyclohydrolase I FolE2 [Verrucomicrobia bacterium]|nr:GTP cyclohydrolase I FolE2 [Verrucomicrobiota bacterium]
MKDVQNRYDNRKIPIQKAGIKDLQYPITVLDRLNKSQHTTAIVSMFVDLPHRFKGTHMSRFVEILNKHHGKISLRGIADILRTMRQTFSCESAHLEIRFPYFIEKSAPASGAKSLMNYNCAFLANIERKRGREMLDLVLEVAVPVTMVCPCSKEISSRGAHNQRSTVTIKVRSHELVWLEELIEIAEKAASSPVYSLLKRQDEKYVTEHAYDRPRFAEDAVRAVAMRLKADKRITWYQIESENQESIHSHSAYAMVVSR